MPLCPIKWQPLKFFAKLHKSPLLISNVVKGAVSDLRRFLVIESPWKIMKNTFYFILTNWICYWQIRFCTYYAFSLKQMSDIREVWKCWPLKDDFCSISQKFTRLPFCGRSTKKLQTFSRHFFWQQSSKYYIAQFTAIFLCSLLDDSRFRRYSMKWSSYFGDQ